MADSEELQTRIGEEMDTDAFIALGTECGCEFTTDDLTAGAELSDEERDGVAGGFALEQPEEHHRTNSDRSESPRYSCLDVKSYSPRELVAPYE